MTAVQPFDYKGQTVRTVQIGGEPWFLQGGSLALLDLGRSSAALLDEDEKGVHTVDTLGGPQTMAVISESGFYSLILRSRKTEAKAIRRWVTGTVLPEIRRTGSFNAAPALQGPELLAAALVESQRILEARDVRIHQLESEAVDAAPKVAYVDSFVTDADLLTLRTVAGHLNVGETWLRELLIARKWIYVQTATRWSNARGCKEEIRRYSAYADHRRHFRPVENHQAPRFKDEVMHTLKVTPAGAEAIARLVDRAKTDGDELAVDEFSQAIGAWS